MNRRQSAVTCFLIASTVLLASCAVAGTESQPAQSALEHPSSAVSSPKVSKKQTRYEVIYFEIDGKKDELAEGAEILVSEPLVGGQIHAIGFCSLPAFDIEAVSAEEWTTRFADIQSGAGCAPGRHGNLTMHLSDLLTGKLQVETSDSSITISKPNYELKLGRV